MVLFRICTHYQLISALCVAKRLNDTADLQICDFTDFTEQQINNIRNTGIFRKVYFCRVKEWVNTWLMSDLKISSFMNDPQNHNIIPDVEYSRVYFGHDMLPNKLYYYYILEKQKIAPEVYILDEGVTSYTQDIYRNTLHDKIHHQSYGKNAYIHRLFGQYLFAPNNAVIVPKHPIIKMPGITNEIKEILVSIYGYHKIPEEKYIFFSSCFYEDKYTTNEVEIAEHFAEVVGKENMIIKPHPRATYNIYELRGFKTMSDRNVPWEIFLLNYRKDDKVLVSVCSTAIFSSAYIFNVPLTIILLKNYYRGNFRVYSSIELKQYLQNAEKYFNSNEKKCYIPKNDEQLIEILKYIKGKTNNEQ